MHQEFRLHGHLNDTIEYFATAAARDGSRSYFYESQRGGLRFFSPGNEIVLDETGIRHRGNGGVFCEYMFGVDQPLADLVKGDVRNRLVLFGATFKENGDLLFTDRTDGRQSYERLFFEGNAICNYLFFLSGSVTGSLQEQQEEILRLLGKILKRTSQVGAADDTELIDELYGLLGHRSVLYLIKLVHKKHKAFRDAFRQLYLADKEISPQGAEELERLAATLGLDRYQQERIRIDVMYRHPDNQPIVDGYRNILVNCFRRGVVNEMENARLTRLKTLSVRNNIPAALFYTLDEMLKHDSLTGRQDQDYISETRQVLEGLFLRERQIDSTIDREDMLKLLQAKRRASENQDHTFEQILLEAGKACDEKIRDGADLSLLENFSYIITYFDRYDTTSAKISQLAFMENVAFSEETIRSLLGNKRAFNALHAGVFDDLFFSGVLENKYLGQFGRRKIECLRGGLTAIEDGRMTVQHLLQRLHDLDREEQTYFLLLGQAKDRIRNFFSRYNTRAEQEALRAEIAEELRHKGMRVTEVPAALFREVILHIKKEAVYLHNLLPRIVADRDIALREDFLANSGLDRFYVEEIEREFFELNGLEQEDLNQIRKGLAA